MSGAPTGSSCGGRWALIPDRERNARFAPGADAGPLNDVGHLHERRIAVRVIVVADKQRPPANARNAFHERGHGMLAFRRPV